MNILFTICGRAGSKGFKNKNLKEINRVPLLYYTLACIMVYADHHPQDQITTALNTDSEELKNLSQQQSALPVHYVTRKKLLAGDFVPKVLVIQDTFLELGHYDFDMVIDLDITSPYRRVCDLENVIDVFGGGNYDVVYSVVEARRSPYFNMVEQKSDGYYRKICDSVFTARQQVPCSYELNASIYAYNTAFLKNNIEKTILDYRCGISIMPDYLVLDIDSENDFNMMQFLQEFYCKQDSKLLEVCLCAKEITQNA